MKKKSTDTLTELDFSLLPKIFQEYCEEVESQLPMGQSIQDLYSREDLVEEFIKEIVSQLLDNQNVQDYYSLEEIIEEYRKEIISELSEEEQYESRWDPKYFYVKTFKKLQRVFNKMGIKTIKNSDEDSVEGLFKTGRQYLLDAHKKELIKTLLKYLYHPVLRKGQFKSSPEEINDLYIKFKAASETYEDPLLTQAMNYFWESVDYSCFDELTEVENRLMSSIVLSIIDDLKSITKLAEKEERIGYLKQIAEILNTSLDDLRFDLGIKTGQILFDYEPGVVPRKK